MSLRLKSRPIGEALHEISRQTGLTFSYSSQLVDVQRLISVDVQDVLLNVALEKILATEYEYKISGKYIVLKKNTQQAPPCKVDRVVVEPVNRVQTKNVSLSSGGVFESDCHIDSNNHKTNTPMNKTGIKSMMLLALSTGFAAFNSSEAQSQRVTENVSNETTNLTANAVEDVGESIAETAKSIATNVSDAMSDAVSNNSSDQDTPPSDSVRPFVATIVYPFSFPELNTEKHAYRASFNVFFGLNNGIEQFEVGGWANVNLRYMKGMQIAGIGNACLGEMSGVQVASISNFAAKGKGLAQISGIVNFGQSVDCQISGTTNMAYKSARTQVAGIVNVTNTADVQVAGLVNAVFNTSRVQIAGIGNTADTADLQIASIINASRKVGTQIGLVNVCDTATGVMIGLVNVARKGGLREVQLGTDMSGNAIFSLRLGLPKFYTFAEIAYNFDKSLTMCGGGLGTQLSFSKGWGMNIEGLSQRVSNILDDLDNLSNDDWWESRNQLWQFRIVAYKRFTKHFAIYAGPSFNIYTTKTTNAFSVDYPAPYTLFSSQHKDYTTKSWVGVSAGIRF
ncbi:hypothetical protein FACS1894199_13610 [Bacteroidia bacterium]|nr:hypothetical protein FACS1894199_13610 [Bacteroidia bacterium]